MLSDTVFSVGGHTIHLSSLYLLLAGMLLLAIAGFLLGLSRGRRVVLQRSGPTDELAVQLGRIAKTLDRIANQSADRSIADDSVLGFQYRADAECFLQEWKERLQKFGLELHPDKTRLIEFGRFAA